MLVYCPLHSVDPAEPNTSGVGLTVILATIGVPAQPLKEGVMV